MYKRILVPVDGSPTSRRGLAEAISLAREAKGKLRVLHVIDEPFTALGLDGFCGAAGDILNLLRENAQRIVDDAVHEAKAAGVDADSAIEDGLEGRLFELAAQQARRWDADLIVIGTHGRRGINRTLLGSDAELILRDSPVPVLLVRGGAPR